MRTSAYFRVWCVEVQVQGGAYHFRTFDNCEEAKRFMSKVIDTVHYGVSIIDVCLWEM